MAAAQSESYKLPELAHPDPLAQNPHQNPRHVRYTDLRNRARLAPVNADRLIAASDMLLKQEADICNLLTKIDGRVKQVQQQAGEIEMWWISQKSSV